MDDYSPPVQHLFSLGRPAEGEWPNYCAGGLGPEHVPELIRLAVDNSLYAKFSADEAPGWGPVHASRALGQLRAVEAVEPLLRLFDEDREPGDWQWEEFSVVAGLIGLPALPALRAYLADETHTTTARWLMGQALVELAQQHPEVRRDSVEALAGVLERADQNDEELNTGMVSCLLDLKAAEAAAVIERAYQAGAVDEGWCGTWEVVLEELGLAPPPTKKLPETPRQPAAGKGAPATPRARAKERARDRKKEKRKKRK